MEENLAKMIFHELIQFNFSDKFFIFTLDNASNR